MPQRREVVKGHGKSKHLPRRSVLQNLSNADATSNTDVLHSHALPWWAVRKCRWYGEVVSMKQGAE